MRHWGRGKKKDRGSSSLEWFRVAQEIMRVISRIKPSSIVKFRADLRKYIRNKVVGVFFSCNNDLSAYISEPYELQMILKLQAGYLLLTCYNCSLLFTLLASRGYHGTQCATWLEKFNMEAESQMTLISVFLIALQGWETLKIHLFVIFIGSCNTEIRRPSFRWICTSSPVYKTLQSKMNFSKCYSLAVRFFPLVYL